MSDKLSESDEMRSEAACLLQQIAEPKANIKATIAQIARKLGWRPSRTKAIWYQDARRIDGHEILALKAEYARLHESVAGILSVLEQADPHKTREQIVADLRRAGRLVAAGRET